MKKLFIAYPSQFLCYSKFERKLDFLTSNMHDFSLTFVEDANSFIADYASGRNISLEHYNSEHDAVDKSSHVLLFESHGCYSELKEHLLKAGKPARVTPLQLTLVVNKDRGEPYDVYIGRGTIWGNPYQIGQDGDREEVIRKFKYDFDKGFLKASEDFEKNIEALKGKIIGCHCKPAACHGDIISNYINSLDDKL